jgi:KDO2-lipid IV(A) lauroyltransferase
MTTWRKKLKYALLIGLVRFLIWSTSWMPRFILHGIFLFLANLAFHVVKKERKKAIRNIQVGYPELTEAEATAFTKRVFLNFGKNAADWGKALHFKSKEQFRKFIRIDGEEHMLNALEKGKGVIALGSHLGAYELYGLYCGLHYPITIGVGAPLKNPTFDQMVKDFRSRRGIDYNHRGSNTLKIVKALKSGKVVIMLIDQDTTKVKNVCVDFFGTKAATPIGATVMAMKTGASVVPMGMSLQGRQQVLTIRPAIEMEVTGDEEADIVHNTQRLTNEVESLIREHPDQWVWFHDRWKTRPENE